MTSPHLTPAQKKILQFFREHPHAVETARGIATWLGSEMETIEEALEALVGWKWVAQDETSALRGYTLTRDERALSQIRETLKAT